jgi:hypothetical protein
MLVRLSVMTHNVTEFQTFIAYHKQTKVKYKSLTATLLLLKTVHMFTWIYLHTFSQSIFVMNFITLY